jgi:diadenosine tetraphosphate (Ap4A) HIT family hydrolase
MSNRFIITENIRREDQKKVMAEIEEKKHCPFCAENLSRYHKNPILKDGTYWILTDNQWPYEKIKHQLLAIYKTHIEHISEMDAMAGAELIEMFKEEAVKRNIPGGGIAMRFGSNPEKGSYGNSVLHLHAHLIEPDLDALAPDERWKFKFGQRRSERDSNQSKQE